MSGPVMVLTRNGQATKLAFPDGTDPFKLLERVRAELYPEVVAREKAEAAQRSNHAQRAVVGRPTTGAWRRPADAHGQAVPDPAQGVPPKERKPAGPGMPGPGKGRQRERKGAPVAVGAEAPPPAGVRDTSMRAYSELKASGALSKQQLLITEHMAAHSARTFTRQELAKALGMGINAVCGRVNELLKEPTNALVERGRKQCEVTGNEVNALALAVRV